MPVCHHCERPFVNKEALQNHLASSSVAHPSCIPCGRRFISQQACDAHMAAKHPPTYDCLKCNRSFLAPFALEDHYRGSSAHPNCAKCGRGFNDNEDRDEHDRTAHPRTTCQICGGMMLYEDALEDHYLKSPNHPSCKQCSRGFKDDCVYVEHMSETHQDLCCGPCDRLFETNEALQIHFLASSNHSQCYECGKGFKDRATYQSHVDSSHGQQDESKINVSVALSPPKSFQDLVVTPSLTVQTSFLSPLKDVSAPIFTASPLPRPGKMIEEVWASRENAPAPLIAFGSNAWSYGGATKSTQSVGEKNNQLALLPKPVTLPIPTPPSISPASSTYTIPRSPDVKSVSYNTVWTTNRLPAKPASATSSDNWRSRPGSSPQQPSPETNTVHPNLMYGQSRLDTPSTKYALPQERPSLTYKDTRARLPLDLPPRAANTTLSNCSPPPRPPQSNVDWKFLLGELPVKSATASSLSDDISTQAVDTPLHSAGPIDNEPGPSEISSLSPTESSIADSTLSPWTGPLPEVVVSDDSSHRSPPAASVKSSWTSQQSSVSSQSPVVASPLGLAALPTVPALPSTPVDAPPAPHPAVEGLLNLVPDLLQSPPRAALETRLPDSPSIALLMSSSRASPTASPEQGSCDVAYENVLAIKLPDSPSTEVAPSPLTPPPASKIPRRTSNAQCVSGVPSPENQESFRRARDRSVSNVSKPSASHDPAPMPRLHCRICQKAPCENITATMCGHIFCYRCITDAVIKTSCCPTCATPTLLYCLFRLDLDS